MLNEFVVMVYWMSSIVHVFSIHCERLNMKKIYVKMMLKSEIWPFSSCFHIASHCRWLPLCVCVCVFGLLKYKLHQCSKYFTWSSLWNRKYVAKLRIWFVILLFTSTNYLSTFRANLLVYCCLLQQSSLKSSDSCKLLIDRSLIFHNDKIGIN